MNPANFSVQEIYPKIYVYNNVFEDTQRMYNIAKDSVKNNDGSIWEKWKDWYTIGEKIEDFGVLFNKSKASLNILKDVEPKNKMQEDQRYFIVEQVKAFLAVTKDYMSRNNLDILEESKKSHKDGHSKWIWTGPSLCKYYVGNIEGSDNGMAMRYHSDFIKEAVKSPGYKFALTCTTYLNDDYDGGAVDFSINNKLVKYKPKAGDLLVFPSGHPDYLTEEGQVYLHGVEICTKTEKYFTRMYWQVYEDGSPEWTENESVYGKEEWLKINQKVQDQIRRQSQRSKIEGATRIL